MVRTGGESLWKSSACSAVLNLSSIFPASVPAQNSSDIATAWQTSVLSQPRQLKRSQQNSSACLMTTVVASVGISPPPTPSGQLFFSWILNGIGSCDETAQQWRKGSRWLVWGVRDCPFQDLLWSFCWPSQWQIQMCKHLQKGPVHTHHLFCAVVITTETEGKRRELVMGWGCKYWLNDQWWWPWKGGVECWKAYSHNNSLNVIKADLTASLV